MGCLQDPPSIPVPRTFQTLGSQPFPQSPKPQGPFPAADAGFMATDSQLLWAPHHVQPPGPGWLHPLPQRLLWEVKHPSPFIRHQLPGNSFPLAVSRGSSCRHRHLTAKGRPSALPPHTQSHGAGSGLGAPEGPGATPRPPQAMLPVALGCSSAASVSPEESRLPPSTPGACQQPCRHSRKRLDSRMCQCSHRKPPAYAFCSVPCYFPTGRRGTPPSSPGPTLHPVFTFPEREIFTGSMTLTPPPGSLPDCSLQKGAFPMLHQSGRGPFNLIQQMD